MQNIQLSNTNYSGQGIVEVQYQGVWASRMHDSRPSLEKKNNFQIHPPWSGDCGGPVSVCLGISDALRPPLEKFPFYQNL